LPSAGSAKIWLQPSFFILTFIIIGVSAWAITSAAIRSQVSERIIRFTRIPGLLIGLALWISFATLLILTILVFAEAPQLAGPVFLLPVFDGLLLCSCGIAAAAMKRMIVSPQPAAPPSL
jgi:hypothetical protein